MKNLLTTKQVAQALGVSDASLKRWCDKGLIPALRTGGGHRRLPLNGVLQFLREQGYPLLRPELLGLPSNAGAGTLVVDRAIEQMTHALTHDDEEQLRSIGFNLYISGTKMVEICDRVLAPAFHQIGLRWQHGELEIYQERRSVEICLRWLHEMRHALPIPGPEAPLAIGGTLANDPYWVATTMAELVLREVGYRAESLGTNLPGATLGAAIGNLHPRLIWLSCSYIGDEEAFVREYEQVHHAALRDGAALAFGGRAADALRHQVRYDAFCGTMQELADFGSGLLAGQSAQQVG